MAYYRFSLFLLTCIACLTFVPSRGDRDRTLTGLYNQNSASVSATPSERGNFPDAQRILLAIAPVVAQETSPKTQKPTSTPNQSKPTPNPKKEKAKSSNSRIPQSLSGIVQFLQHQKVLLLLSLAAVLVTGAAVFVLLKLLDHEEEDRLKSKPAIAPKQNPPKNQPKNQNYQENTSSQPNSERPSPLVSDPGNIESQQVIPSSKLDTLSAENYNNGYNETDLSHLEKINSTEQLVNNITDIVEETSHPPQINIEQLIEDLAHPNPAKRHKAIWELGDRGDSRAVRPLVNLLLDSDSNQHSLILSSLSEIGIKTIKPMNRAWVISLQNENPEVRKNAIRDLTRIYELVNQISHLLQRAKDDPNPEVQETARWALTQLNRESSPASRDQL
jgi:hypothetical protein